MRDFGLLFSQNRGTVEGGRDLWKSSVHPLPEQGHREQIAQDQVPVLPV